MSAARSSAPVVQKEGNRVADAAVVRNDVAEIQAQLDFLDVKNTPKSGVMKEELVFLDVKDAPKPEAIEEQPVFHDVKDTPKSKAKAPVVSKESQAPCIPIAEDISDGAIIYLDSVGSCMLASNTSMMSNPQDVKKLLHCEFGVSFVLF